MTPLLILAPWLFVRTLNLNIITSFEYFRHIRIRIWSLPSFKTLPLVLFPVYAAFKGLKTIAERVRYCFYLSQNQKTIKNQDSSCIDSNRFPIFSFMNLQANSIWLYIVPRGMRSLMNYIKNNYGNPLVIITENGKYTALSKSKHTNFWQKVKI